jgi:hypothetical protein
MNTTPLPQDALAAVAHKELSFEVIEHFVTLVLQVEGLTEEAQKVLDLEAISCYQASQVRKAYAEQTANKPAKTCLLHGQEIMIVENWLKQYWAKILLTRDLITASKYLLFTCNNIVALIESGASSSAGVVLNARAAIISAAISLSHADGTLRQMTGTDRKADLEHLIERRLGHATMLLHYKGFCFADKS